MNDKLIKIYSINDINGTLEKDETLNNNINKITKKYNFVKGFKIYTIDLRINIVFFSNKEYELMIVLDREENNMVKEIKDMFPMIFALNLYVIYK